MPTDYRQYLNPEIVSKLKGMDLRARMVVEGFVKKAGRITGILLYEAAVIWGRP